MNHPRLFRQLRIVVVLVLALLVTLSSAATLEELRRDAQQNPTSVSAHIALGMHYYEAGGLVAARDAFREAIALDYRVTAAHYGLGLTEFARGDYPAALFAFSEVVRLDPDRFDAYYNRAVTFATLGQPLDAIAAYREALSKTEFGATPDDEFHAHVGLARELGAVREYQAAADALGRALDIDASDTELQLRRAQLLVQAGSGLDALPYLTDIEAETNDYRISALKADIYIAAEQSEFARWSLERVIETASAAGLSEVVANTYLRIAELEYSLGNEQAYRTALERANEANPGTTEAAYNLGAAYQADGNFAAAAEQFATVLQNNPEHTQAAIARAVSLEQLGENELVLQQVETLRTNDLTSAEHEQVETLYARALYRAGNISAAYKVFSELRDAGSTNPDVYTWGGLALYQLERFTEATEWLERAQTFSSSETVRAYLAAAYLAAGDYRAAERSYQALVADAATDQRAEYEYYLGWSLLQQERFSAAGDAWERACDLDYADACFAKESYL